MPEKIQRIPLGLQNVIGAFGGRNPVELGDTVGPVLELLQFYGQTQLQRFQGTGTPAEAVPVIGATVPAGQWWVLFRAHAGATKTATMTALRVSLFVGTIVCASTEGGPFGATETGVVHLPFVPPYPLLLPPGTSVFASCPIIGTDATAALTCNVEAGVLG